MKSQIILIFLLLARICPADENSVIKNFKDVSNEITRNGGQISSFSREIIDKSVEFKLVACAPFSREYDFYIVTLTTSKKQYNLKVIHDDKFTSIDEISLFLRTGKSKRGLKIVEIRAVN